MTARIKPVPPRVLDAWARMSWEELENEHRLIMRLADREDITGEWATIRLIEIELFMEARAEREAAGE